MLALLLALALQSVERPVTGVRQEIFDQIDRFEPLDTTDCRFVWVGAGTREEPSEPGWFGFLLSEHGRCFTIRSVDGSELTLHFDRGGAFDYGPYHWQPADLASTPRDGHGCCADGRVFRARQAHSAPPNTSAYRSRCACRHAR